MLRMLDWLVKAWLDLILYRRDYSHELRRYAEIERERIASLTDDQLMRECVQRTSVQAYSELRRRGLITPGTAAQS